MEAGTCKNHADRTGTWKCSSCQGLFCDECVNLQIDSCKACGGLCKPYGAAPSPAQKQEVEKKVRPGFSEKKSFFSMLPGAFVYPFKGSGIFVLVLGVIFFGIMNVMKFMPIAGLLFAVVGTGYFTAFMFKIVNTTAMGRVDLPEWPDMTDLWSDIIAPFFSIVMTFVVSFGPAVVCLLLAVYFGVSMPRGEFGRSSNINQPSSNEQMTFMGNEGDQTYNQNGVRVLSNKSFSSSGMKNFSKPEWAQALKPMICIILAFVFFLAGLVYFPMALLATALETGLQFHPFVIFGSIFKVFVPYLISCFIFIVIAVASSLISFVLFRIHPLVFLLVNGFISFYFTIVEMRIIGLIYFTNSERLMWFDE